MINYQIDRVVRNSGPKPDALPDCATSRLCKQLNCKGIYQSLKNSEAVLYRFFWRRKELFGKKSHKSPTKLSGFVLFGFGGAF